MLGHLRVYELRASCTGSAASHSQAQPWACCCTEWGRCWVSRVALERSPGSHLTCIHPRAEPSKATNMAAEAGIRMPKPKLLKPRARHPQSRNPKLWILDPGPIPMFSPSSTPSTSKECKGAPKPSPFFSKVLYFSLTWRFLGSSK